MNYLEKLWTLTVKERKQIEGVLEVLRAFHKCEDMNEDKLEIVEKVAKEYEKGYTKDDLKQEYMELLTECYEIEHMSEDYMEEIDRAYDCMIETIYGNVTHGVLNDDKLISCIYSVLGFGKDIDDFSIGYEVRHYVKEVKKLYA